MRHTRTRLLAAALAGLLLLSAVVGANAWLVTSRFRACVQEGKVTYLGDDSAMAREALREAAKDRMALFAHIAVQFMKKPFRHDCLLLIAGGWASTQDKGRSWGFKLP